MRAGSVCLKGSSQYINYCKAVNRLVLHNWNTGKYLQCYEVLLSSFLKIADCWFSELNNTVRATQSDNSRDRCGAMPVTCTCHAPPPQHLPVFCFLVLPPCRGECDVISVRSIVLIYKRVGGKQNKQGNLSYLIPRMENDSDHLTRPAEEHSDPGPSAFRPKNFYFPSGSTMKLILPTHLLLSLSHMETDSSLSTPWVPRIYSTTLLTC